MAGIAPTLIFLRTSLASNDNTVLVSQMLSTLRFGEPPTVVSENLETSENPDARSAALQPVSFDRHEDVEAQKVGR
ncbi:hypothetical protein VNI00_014438 [Paramarasmius palmivorus]|uniref:Uncharacterized protein n=1 Tax=Paramarasmius palmivorus TaxID=297713 RepID=A0AAW0BS32_9AGAR